MSLDLTQTVRAFGEGYFNLIRRGADGSLTMSTDHWRLETLTAEAFHFAAQEEDAPPLVLPLAQVERTAWDRLPKQQQRSQIRFYLVSGDLWTFSGSFDESVLPSAEDVRQ
ncbi:MAG TPA: hypothetical protein VFG86_26610 [Chloroflexota bacterium]|nr:hypothetical protein [Chloroflexota bacterium]